MVEAVRFYRDRHREKVVRRIHHQGQPHPGDLGTRYEPQRAKNIRGVMKKLPKHSSEAEERDFWAKEDSSEFIDWKAASRVTFSKLKPSLRTISLRLPEMMIEELKLLANKMDVPYQTLIKIYRSERIQKELKSARA
jgi:predicted DNA binding CopG/RHH family protein